MHRPIRFFSLIILVLFAGLPGATAAPQILALVETLQPTPLVCSAGVCEAEFSTLCLQKDRNIPERGTAYAPSDAAGIVLVLRRADGTTARVHGHPGLRFTVPGTYVSVTATVSEAEIGRLGAVAAAIEVAPLQSLIPVPEPGDTNPQTAEEIAKVTGPVRMSARRAVLRQKDTITAARATNRLANALLVDPAAGREARDALWERIAADGPKGATAAGIEQARKIVRACQSYEAAQGEEGFRGCLRYRRDQLMFGINDTYWHRNDVGS